MNRKKNNLKNYCQSASMNNQECNNLNLIQENTKEAEEIQKLKKQLEKSKKQNKKILDELEKIKKLKGTVSTINFFLNNENVNFYNLIIFCFKTEQ